MLGPAVQTDNGKIEYVRVGRLSRVKNNPVRVKPGLEPKREKIQKYCRRVKNLRNDQM